MPVTGTGTENRASWENSRARQQTVSAHPAGAGWKTVVLVTAGTIALLVLGAFFWLTRRGESTTLVAPVAPAATDLASAPARPTEAVPPAAPSPTESAAKSSAAPVDTGRAATEGARPAEATNPIPGAAPAPEPPTAAPTPDTRVRRNPPPPAAPAPGKGLTDFGGRR